MAHVIGDRHSEKGSFSEERLSGRSQWTAEDALKKRDIPLLPGLGVPGGAFYSVVFRTLS